MYLAFPEISCYAGYKAFSLLISQGSTVACMLVANSSQLESSILSLRFRSWENLPVGKLLSLFYKTGRQSQPELQLPYLHSRFLSIRSPVPERTLKDS